MTTAVTATPAAARRRGGWAALPALFLCVLGARLWLIGHYGNALPFWDQWDAEGGEVIRPWLDDQLRFADLLRPHAEHRIFLTRLTALGLTAANGQWDARLEMVFNAFLAAFLAVGLAWGLRRALFPRFQGLVLLGTTALFSLPFAWENTLAGFQSQFYFLMGNSLLALWGLGTRRAGSVGWFLGVAGALAACFSMGSGLLAALAVGIWIILRALGERRGPGGGELGTLLVCVAVAALGWQLRVSVPQHDTLRAEGVGSFVAALGRGLAWPRVTKPGWGLPMVAPLVVLAIVHWGGGYRRHGRGAAENNAAAGVTATGRGADYLLGLSVWVLLQAAAMAYVRGGEALPPPSRYMDLLALGTLLSALALAWLVAEAVPPGPWRELSAAGAGLWAACLLVGLGDLTTQDFSGYLPERRTRQAAGAEATRRYLVDDADRRLLLDAPPDDAYTPYPNGAYLLDLLDHPGIRRLLPMGFHREPVTAGPLSRVAESFVRGGGILFVLGTTGLLAVVWWTASSSVAGRLPQGQEPIYRAGTAAAPTAVGTST